MMTKQKGILTFKLHNEEMGLDISYVREVLRFQEIHPLPQGPAFLEGVINLRGNIIVVMDLKKKFRLKTDKDLSKSRIIICRLKQFIVGLIVDSVHEVIRLSEDLIQSTPEIVSTQMQNTFIAGVGQLGERVIILLDLEKILTFDEEESLIATGRGSSTKTAAGEKRK